MKTKKISLEEEDLSPKSNRIQNKATFSRISFIIGIVSIVLAVLLSIIVVVTQKPGIITVTILTAIFLFIALIGTISGGLSFRIGKDVYGILGFIFNLIMIAYNIVALIAMTTSSLWLS